MHRVTILDMNKVLSVVRGNSQAELPIISGMTLDW